MTGRNSNLDTDGTTCWRPEPSTPQHHLKNWKVMLWVLASLLTLMEEVFSDEDTTDTQSHLQSVLRGRSVSPKDTESHLRSVLRGRSVSPEDTQSHFRSVLRGRSVSPEDTKSHFRSVLRGRSVSPKDTESHLRSVLRGRSVSPKDTESHLRSVLRGRSVSPDDTQSHFRSVLRGRSVSPEDTKSHFRSVLRGRSVSPEDTKSHFRSVLRGRSVSPAEDQDPDQDQDQDQDPVWPHVLAEWSLMQEVQQSRWRRSRRDPDRRSRRNRKKSKTSRDCHMEKKQMHVRDLGLGYDSDEIVVFKYCVGSCHDARRNYDLALQALVDLGSVSGTVSSRPCCRPSRYETVSFMDSHTTWQTIRWLSAANCSCLG